MPHVARQDVFAAGLSKRDGPKAGNREYVATHVTGSQVKNEMARRASSRYTATPQDDSGGDSEQQMANQEQAVKPTRRWKRATKKSVQQGEAHRELFFKTLQDRRLDWPAFSNLFPFLVLSNKFYFACSVRVFLLKGKVALGNLCGSTKKSPQGSSC
jgi:hypothetical protein